MKPIDALTSLPRSLDVAKVAANQGRHGEVQAQGQILSLMREMSQKNHTVNEAMKTVADNKTDSETSGGGGSASGFLGGRGHGGEKEEPETQHPSKGKVLDIKGDLDA